MNWGRFLGLSLEHNLALYAKTSQDLPLLCIPNPEKLPFLIIGKN